MFAGDHQIDSFALPPSRIGWLLRWLRRPCPIDHQTSCHFSALTFGEHVTKTGYKFVEHAQGRASAEVVTLQVIPDLALYRTQIINLLGFDPEQIDWSVHPGEEFDVAQAILWSAGMISRYIEPLEHDEANRHEFLRTENLFVVPVQLHMAAVALGDRHGVDLVDAHRKRMER